MFSVFDRRSQGRTCTKSHMCQIDGCRGNHPRLFLTVKEIDKFSVGREKHCKTKLSESAFLWQTKHELTEHEVKLLQN